MQAEIKAKKINISDYLQTISNKYVVNWNGNADMPLIGAVWKEGARFNQSPCKWPKIVKYKNQLSNILLQWISLNAVKNAVTQWWKKALKPGLIKVRYTKFRLYEFL